MLSIIGCFIFGFFIPEFFAGKRCVPLTMNIACAAALALIAAHFIM